MSPSRARARSPFDLPRWTAADARDVITALERSGQPVSVFAAEHGLDAQRVYLWRRRLRASSAEAEPTTFRELTLRPALAGSVGGARFEIVLPSGMMVRVAPPFDADDLALLLDVLARAGAC